MFTHGIGYGQIFVCKFTDILVEPQIMPENQIPHPSKSRNLR